MALTNGPFKAYHMYMSQPILDYVLTKLQDRMTPWTEVARQTGIPYDTLKKIARGVTANPGVLHVQVLHDYFKQQDLFAGNVSGDKVEQNKSPQSEAAVAPKVK